MSTTQSPYQTKQKLILLAVVCATVLPSFLACCFWGQHYSDLEKDGIAVGFGALAFFSFMVLIVCFAALIETLSDFFKHIFLAK